jgi:EPS-associated MarR family transcriptional regulator
MLSEEDRFRLFRLIEANPQMSQRDLAHALGISLGKVNYCITALISRGWVKASNFKNSKNKAAYMYFLTPRGIQEKAAVTAAFLQRKMQEHDALKDEIQALRADAEERAANQLANQGEPDPQ